jgi:membrane protease YdiL (CAAX protease family)
MYAAYVRVAEKRPLAEFSRAGAWRELGAGLVLGFALFATTIGILAMLGLYQVRGVRTDASLLIIPLAISVGAGVIEEVIFRGVIFRIVESSLGTWIALAISSLLFGLVHLGNPNATVLSSVAIMLEAGLMLAGAYLLTRRLWLPIGVHIGWNFTQGGIFSVPVSGYALTGLVDGTLSGPDWLSGGVFGAEASVVAVIVCVSLAIWLLRRAAQRGQFIAPRWRRDAVPTTPSPTLTER